jgi:hypothetical protein
MVSSFLLAKTLVAQQHSERFLPVTVVVTQDGGAAEQITVTLYKDNIQVTQLLPTEHSAFELALDLDSYYSIRISKPGFRDKLVFVDSHLPDGVQRFGDYVCEVHLEPMERFSHSDPFYLDFPSAVVRWDATKQDYDHSEEYLTDIQGKVALLSLQAE